MHIHLLFICYSIIQYLFYSTFGVRHLSKSDFQVCSFQLKREVRWKRVGAHRWRDSHPMGQSTSPLLQVLDGYLPMVEPHLDVLIERRRVNITNGVSELVSEVMGDPQATIGFNTI